MTAENPAEVAPITFNAGVPLRTYRLRIDAIQKMVTDPTCCWVTGTRDATPADLAACGFTSNAECARVLNDLQQAHVREISAVRGELERAKATKSALRKPVRTISCPPGT